MATVTTTRTVPAPPEAVWLAWVDADRLATWWWPQLAGTTYDVEAHEGGAYRIHSPALGAGVSGSYTELAPPHRLAFTWSWQDDGAVPDGVDAVVVRIEAADEGHSEVTVDHTCAEEAMAGYEQGWADVLDRLAGLTW